jgi:hypothetical protein
VLAPSEPSTSTQGHRATSQRQRQTSRGARSHSVGIDARAVQIADELQENFRVEEEKGEGKGRRSASPSEEGERPYERGERD